MYQQLRSMIYNVILEKMKQGYDGADYLDRLVKSPDSYDVLIELSREIEKAPFRPDWPYDEPDNIEEILSACDPAREKGKLAILTEDEINAKVQAAFMSSICGCILGKPLEEAPYGTLDDIRDAAKRAGEWPIRNYITETMLHEWGRRNPSWKETTRGNISFVAPDDDITYTLCGMLLLEKRGADFDYHDMKQLWLEKHPIYMCWGPERTVLLKAGLASLFGLDEKLSGSFAVGLNPGQEYCGALIRVDAYAYAYPGFPEMAARLACKDALFTHRKSGVYAAMFVAAAISAAFVAEDPMEIFKIALRYVPQNSRFFENVNESILLVESSGSFDAGYQSVHAAFSEYGACRIFQEIGTIINTMKYAKDIEEGLGLQIAQGNDTDSYGCTCGSILGAYFGQELPKHWTQPFNDLIHTTMGNFYETSLSKIVARMRNLHHLAEKD